MQNFHTMDELLTNLALVKHPWVEIYLTGISLSWNMDLYLFVWHAFYKSWFCVTFRCKTGHPERSSALFWRLKWGASGVKGQSSHLKSNAVCSEIISECKYTAQNKTMGSIEGAQLTVKASTPRRFKSTSRVQNFPRDPEKTTNYFCKSRSHWKLLEWGPILTGHSRLGRQIWNTLY